MDPQPNSTLPPTGQTTDIEYQVAPLPVAPLPIGMEYKSTEAPVKKKHRFLKPLLICLLCEVLIGAGTVVYFWRDGMAIDQQNADAETIQELQQQIVDLQSRIQQYDPDYSFESDYSLDDEQVDYNLMTEEEFLQSQ